MPFCHRRNQLLVAQVLFQPLLDFRHRGPRPVLIALVHDHHVGQVEHDDFLQLQPAAVIRIHDQNGLIDDCVLKRHRFLSRANGLHNDVIEIGVREQRETIARRRRNPPACPRVAMLRIKTRSSCELIMVARSPSNAPSPTTLGSCERSRSRPSVAVQKSEDELIDQRRLARAARPGKPNDTRFRCFELGSLLDAELDVRRFVSIRVGVFDLGQIVGQFLSSDLGRGRLLWFAVSAEDKFHHVVQ